METTTTLLLVVGVMILAAPLLGSSAAAAGAGDDGFSVEFIHRDSVKSPFHDPALTPHGRALAAARRSAARAAELHQLSRRSVSGSGAGVVAEVVSRQFEYLMAIEVGSPPVRVLAIADTGSDLVWVKCKSKDNDNNNSTFFSDDDDSPPPSSDDDAPPPSAADEPPTVYFVPSASSTYGRVGCDTDACRALSSAASCSPDGSDACEYLYSYGDGSRASGRLSTETFTFSTISDSSNTNAHNSSRHGQVKIAKLDFGCSTTTAGTFRADGLVGLGGGPLSLASQLGAATSYGRKFSYCLAPYADADASSALNFGSRAVVSEPGAASTPLVAGQVDTYYTIALDSIKISDDTNKPTTLAQPKTKAQSSSSSSSSSGSKIIVDSGTTLTYLDEALLTPLAKDLTRRIKLPRAESPEKLLDLCYDISGVRDEESLGIPDVKLVLGGGGGGEVTLKPENTFVVVQEGVLCLALVATSERQSVSILGNIAQQNLHVGYDLDQRTVTFAAADCARSHPYGAADV